MRPADISAWLTDNGVLDREERQEVMYLVRRLDSYVHEQAAKPNG